MATLRKDEIYFMEIVIFQVEDCLFKVPKYHFENSSKVFASRFLLPNGEGSSEVAPVKLDGISTRDFRNFLATLYPLSHSTELSKDQWISTLKLSTMWMFLEHRKAAIKELLSLPITIHTILLGRAYSSLELFTEGCSALICRSTFLSDEEASTLGYETAFRLCNLREKRYSKGQESTHAEIAQVFEKEILAIAGKQAQYGPIPKLHQPKLSPPPLDLPVKKRRRHISDIQSSSLTKEAKPISRNPYSISSHNP